jgi:hypothetical protein
MPPYGRGKSVGSHGAGSHQKEGVTVLMILKSVAGASTSFTKQRSPVWDAVPVEPFDGLADSLLVEVGNEETVRANADVDTIIRQAMMERGSAPETGLPARNNRRWVTAALCGSACSALRSGRPPSRWP